MYFTRAAGFTQPVRGIARRFRHIFSASNLAEISLKFSPSLADTAGKPKFRLGSASHIETLAIVDVASPMWEQASSCLS
jgi:hypothetical protein